MKIAKPYKTATLKDITQGFSDTHKANDFASEYGTWLCSPFNGKVDVITGAEALSPQTPSFELQRGNGIRIVSVERPEVSIVFWHCLPVFPVEVGQTVLMGQTIAQMGNSGYVLSNGTVVPYELRDNPPYLGTHAHISMGTAMEYWDYSALIDWSIPVGTNTLDAIYNTLKKIFNLLK
jgi:murein DD-endopeptidase MepM/ murein hydrolase activator NlpD